MYDILMSFDRTGSMASCFRQVQHKLDDFFKTISGALTDVRVGLIAHGDYCDGPNFIQTLDFTNDLKKLRSFADSYSASGGGDAPECYELAINMAYSFSWRVDAKKSFILIGDDEPHKKGYRHGSHVNNLDWKEEARQLVKDKNVKIYSVQALARYSNTKFYEELAQIGNGVKLDLTQFDDVVQYLTAISYNEAGKLSEYVPERSNSRIVNLLDVLSGRKTTKSVSRDSDLEEVHPSRFQALTVHKDCPIKEFVQSNDLTFKLGRGFYEFTKTVTIQNYKEVVIEDKKTGKFYTGDKARNLLGIPIGETARVRPSSLADYRGFIQSTSVNRKLLKGTSFLYEVEDL